MADGSDRLALKICGQGRGTRKIKHGLFANFRAMKIDGRSRVGKHLNYLIAQLTAHCGGPDQLSVTQAIVIDGLAAKCLRRHLYNLKFLKDRDPGAHAHILALENSIRLDCQLLGLDRKAKKVMDLTEYIRMKDAEKAKEDQ
jgi:hypothetical protein